MTVTEARVTEAPVDVSPPAVGPVAAAGGGTRGRRQGTLGRLRGDIPAGATIALGFLGIATLVGGWQLASTFGSDTFRVPSPGSTWTALVELARSGDLVSALRASSGRIAVSYVISMGIGIVLGVLMGSLRSVEAFFEPQIGFLRYIPATALTILFLLWLGIDEAPKIALVAVGTVFYNILMIADVARAVPMELVNASYTLGAGRITVLRRVILPHSYPGIIDVARINLAAAWVLLVVSELQGGQAGLAYELVQSQRFRQYDRIFAILLVFGVIGALSDVALRQLRKRTAPWSAGST